MPSDLFGDISTRVPSVVSRRTHQSVVLVSIAAHAVVFVAALFFSVASPGLLPTPRTALAYFDSRRPVKLMDIELPTPQQPAAAVEPQIASVPMASINAAPLTAPTGIRPESNLEPAPAPARSAALESLESRPGAGTLGPVMRVEQTAAVLPVAPVRLHSGIREPIKLVHVDPLYPTLAQGARVQGVVILEAVIDTAGRVDSVQVLRSIGLLDQAAIAAVRQWRYQPATVNGSPVAVILTITVNFKMER